MPGGGTDLRSRGSGPAVEVGDFRRGANLRSARRELLAFQSLHEGLAVLVVAVQRQRVTGGRQRGGVIAKVLVDDGEVAVHLGAVAAQPRGGVVRLAGAGPVRVGGRISVGVLVERVVPSLDRVRGFVRNIGAGLGDRRAGQRDGLSLGSVVVGIGQVRQDDGRDGQRGQGK